MPKARTIAFPMNYSVIASIPVIIQGGECQELATIDMLKERADRAQERTDLPPTKTLPRDYLNNRQVSES